MSGQQRLVVSNPHQFTDAHAREFVQDVLNAIITGRSAMPDEVEVHFAHHLDVPTALVKLRIEKVFVEVLLIAYEPTVRLSAADLNARADAVWQASMLVDRVADALDTKEEVLALAGDRCKRTEFRAEVAAAAKTQDTHCIALLDMADDIRRWDPIPADTQVDVFAYTLSHPSALPPGDAPLAAPEDVFKHAEVAP